ncbi:TPA: MFS transporter, partial [Escherichia coli]
FLCVSLLPAVGAVIRIVIMSKYTFTEEKHAEICEKLKRGEFHHSVLISKK